MIHLVFFNDTATTEIYTLSLHDALPIYAYAAGRRESMGAYRADAFQRLVCEGGTTVDTTVVDGRPALAQDRKSTRLNSSHQIISYAVFCLKKKKHKEE